MQPVVSLIVPIYGVEQYIEKCAESALRQSYPAIQFVFVNDGTKDRSMEVLSGVLERFPERDVTIVNKENGGLPQARLSGLKVAKGEYIMHLDSDDWLEPDAVSLLISKAAETGADLVYYNFWKEYPHRSKLDREKPYSAANKTKYMRRLYNDGAYGYLWNKFCRRELYDGVFFPKYNMHEDVVVATQLIFKAARIEQLPVPLVHYRRDNPSASTRVGKKKRRGQMARNYLDLYEHYLPALETSPIGPVVNDILLRAAWVAESLDRELYEERPYLAAAAKHLPLMPGHRVLLVQQLWLKLNILFP